MAKWNMIMIPVNGITCVTGVSGSGKSSLIKVVSESLRSNRSFCCEKIKKRSLIKHVEEVDQKPIGKTPRSTVISYLGIYDEIRNLRRNRSCRNQWINSV